MAMNWSIIHVITKLKIRDREIFLRGIKEQIRSTGRLLGPV